MGLNETVSADRVHIGFFGMRNAGKSSVVNALTGQELSVVSDVKGTTTDPVKKAMELLPLGPVVIIDTPGFDDEGDLGELRIKKTKQVLNYTDIAVLVVDSSVGMTDLDNNLLSMFEEKKIPHLIVYNKSDIVAVTPDLPSNSISVSALSGDNINALKDRIAS
ncbi:MAG: GTP-binding protein, partial [Ruminococcaceae bacterium]|nr:GTP-binding protein [Oscillospiraceae bacterium]